MAIAAAYNGLKAGREILSAVVDAKIEGETRTKINDVLTKLGSAQDTMFEMREELFKLQTETQDLRRKLAEEASWEKRMSGYALKQTTGGPVVYASASEPLHYICPSCVNKREVHILQDNRTMSGKYRCTGCEAEYPIKPHEKLPQLPSGGNIYT